MKYRIIKIQDHDYKDRSNPYYKIEKWIYDYAHWIPAAWGEDLEGARKYIENIIEQNKPRPIRNPGIETVVQEYDF